MPATTGSGAGSVQARSGIGVRPRRDFAGRAARRLQAAEMFTGGKRQVDVAAELGVSAQTASRWYRAWSERGATKRTTAMKTIRRNPP